MLYKGIELVEILPPSWNGVSRKMLVWKDFKNFNPEEDICIEFVIGYDDQNKWCCSNGYRYDHCAEIPAFDSLIDISICITEIDTIVAQNSSNPDMIMSGVVKLYSSISEYLKKYALLNRRIDTAIKLIQNDQAITAMGVLRGEDDELLNANPLQDYPPEQLNEHGYRKIYDKHAIDEYIEKINALDETIKTLAAERSALARDKADLIELNEFRLDRIRGLEALLAKYEPAN